MSYLDKVTVVKLRIEAAYLEQQMKNGRQEFAKEIKYQSDLYEKQISAARRMIRDMLISLEHAARREHEAMVTCTRCVIAEEVIAKASEFLKADAAGGKG